MQCYRRGRRYGSPSAARDRAIGDADHGENMDRGFRAVVSKVDTAAPETPGAVLKLTATVLISTVGGASGPLYGTAFLRAAAAVGEAAELDGPAVATALRANPAVNVSFGGDKLVKHKRVHLGVAVAIEDGLVVPVLKDADRKSVSELAAEGREKAGRAREGKLKPDEMSGGTFTISNLGMFGIEQFSAVINPPEAAILAVGAAKDELQLVDGEVVARKILRVTLSADHRAIDGAVGAAFLQQFTSLLEDPIRIIA